MEQPKSPRLQRAEAQVQAHPLKELFKLPPEEVLDFFRSRVGTALLEGLSRLKLRERDALMSSALSSVDTHDKLFEVRGIDSVCTMVVRLPEEINSYVSILKKEQ